MSNHLDAWRTIRCDQDNIQSETLENSAFNPNIHSRSKLSLPIRADLWRNLWKQEVTFNQDQRNVLALIVPLLLLSVALANINQNPESFPWQSLGSNLVLAFTGICAFELWLFRDPE